MNPLGRKPAVIIRACDSYDVPRIRKIIREGMEELDLRPSGRTLLKPNIVASGPLFPHAFTRPEFTEGVLLALKDRDDGSMTELAVGERCGITIPTRTGYNQAGYDGMFRRLKMKRYCFEEETQVEIPLTHEGRLRDYFFTPEPVARADFLVNCPKFKAHPWSTVTFSTKNYIGIQDDRHRLIDHDHRLEEKIADLQYIVQSEFIAIDAITAGEGRMLTPTPFPLGLVIMGNNQLAFDAICSLIIGVDPASVGHLNLIHERGFGPIDPASIELSGDVSLEEAQKKAEGFEVGLIRVEKYFENSNICAYAGPPPEREVSDYCWGGCPGSVEEAIEILRIYDEQVDKKMPRTHIVFGAYDGPIDVREGEKVLFIGDCTTWKGNLNGEAVEIKSLYENRDTKDPHCARHSDIYKKIGSVIYKFSKNRKETCIRMPGCPVSVAEHVLALVRLSHAKNPYFDIANVLSFNRGYIAWRFNRLAAALTNRKPYQRRGPYKRGRAAPEI